MTGRLDESLDRVLGKRSAKPLEDMGITTVGQLLRHVPRRVDDPGQLTQLNTLREGEHVTVMARVSSATIRQMRARNGSIMTVKVTDGTNFLVLTFFAKYPGALRVHESRLVPGREGMFTGTVSSFRDQVQLTHPDYLLIGQDVDDEIQALIESSRPTPVYPASVKLPSWKIRAAIRVILDPLTEDDLPDYLPDAIRNDLGTFGRAPLIPLIDAMRGIHNPLDRVEWTRARARIRFDEAFIPQLVLAKRRRDVAAQEAIARPGRTGGLLDALDARLPFTLTAGQREIGAEISEDLASPHPMQRLLQGDVGSGKTVIALRAMLQVVDSGGQAALLAPTEVLAAQHVRSLRAHMGPLAEGGMLGGSEDGTRITLLTGSQSAGERRKALLEAASGQAGIVVGTHALIQDNVQFADLGLVVVDEQHRFGVEQRDALRAKATGVPHLLTMTATPIPRTVAMTKFGDLFISTLSEMPEGRSPIESFVVHGELPRWIERTWVRARQELDKGHRVFVVCPRISPDDKTLAPEVDSAPDDAADDAAPRTPKRPPKAVLEVADELRAMELFKDIPIGILHGRMTPEEKESAMAAFADGSVPLLVSTTVIEVGIDVPEATAMIILDADRFGMAQLHQLRGRVGRGSAPGLTFFVSEVEPGLASERLDVVAGTQDGFQIANDDLRLRREGDVLGAAQSGKSSSMRYLKILEDDDVIRAARKAAEAMLDEDPSLESWPVLVSELDRLDPDRKDFLERS